MHIRVFCLLSALLLGAAVPLGAAEDPKPAAPAASAPATDAPHAEGAKDTHVKDAHGADHAAGHGHDNTDLSHGNGTANIANPADLRFDLSIYTFLVFLILLAILYKFAWGPIAAALEQREETIARNIEEARLAAEKARRQLQEYEAKLAAAMEQSRQIMAEARKDAEVAKAKIVAEAQEAAAEERDRAVADITTAKNQALQEIAQKSVSTAVSLASNIIRREVRPEDHEQLINQSLKQFTSLN